MELDRQAWEQLHGESNKAHAAFLLYRDQPRETRSMVEVVRLLKESPQGPKSIKQIEAWSSAHRWRERAKAWDAEVERIRAAAFANEVAATAKRHAQIAAQNMGVLMAPVLELTTRINQKRLNLVKVPDVALFQMVQKSAGALKALVEIERLSRGMSLTNEENKTNDETTAVGKTVADHVRAMFAASGDDATEPDNAVDTTAEDDAPVEPAQLEPAPPGDS